LFAFKQRLKILIDIRNLKQVIFRPEEYRKTLKVVNHLCLMKIPSYFGWVGQRSGRTRAKLPDNDARSNSERALEMDCVGKALPLRSVGIKSTRCPGSKQALEYSG
jgi:hypothetical protein